MVSLMPTRTARLIRRHPVTAIFATLAIVIGGPTAVVLAGQHETDVRLERSDHRLIDYQVSNEVARCEAANGSRKALQTVLDRAADPPATGAAALDLTAIDGFDRLDVETRGYLMALQAALDRPGGSSNLSKIAADYHHDYPSNVNCDAKGRSLRRTLEGRPRA